MVSDADCRAVGHEFESRRIHGCLYMYRTYAAGGILNSHQAASPLVRSVEGEEWWESFGYPQGFLPLNWGGT
ncbi:hypothetical protein TNCV_1174841 [Trichonephila clavipes]|nr:hypothetical protein TNCV_1174841 [Trichonephila clavipes]